jgi:hypothetical protein
MMTRRNKNQSRTGNVPGVKLDNLNDVIYQMDHAYPV